MPTSLPQPPWRLPVEQPLLLLLLQRLTVTPSSSKMEHHPAHPCKKMQLLTGLQEMQMPLLQLVRILQQLKQQQQLRQRTP